MDALESQASGWEKRGVYDDPRLTELIQMYEELGFIVRTEPFHPESETGCRECMRNHPDTYKVVYTKKST